MHMHMHMHMHMNMSCTWTWTWTCTCTCHMHMLNMYMCTYVVVHVVWTRELLRRCLKAQGRGNRCVEKFTLPYLTLPTDASPLPLHPRLAAWCF